MEKNNRRKFLTRSMAFLSSTGILSILWPFLSYMSPTARERGAGAPVKVDISNLKDGEKIDLIWRKKPIWVIRRSKAMIDGIELEENKYKDPLSENLSQQPEFARNKYRSLKPEILVLEGICTHLGCNPSFRPKIESKNLDNAWSGGFFCACHGSKFDFAGKVYSGVPAGANLKVPPYRFDDDNTIVIGEMPFNKDEESTA